MIEIDGLTKRYGDKTAVDRLSFVVEPGVVTGFLGPNGAGKSTTMRVIAGLDRPTSGTVRVNGKHYPEAAAPMSELGILLDARSVHPGLSARSNLLALARTAGIGRRRVDEVIELTGLAEVAGTRAGGLRLLAPDERDGADRDPAGRAGTAASSSAETSVAEFVDHAAAGGAGPDAGNRTCWARCWPLPVSP